MRAWGILAVLVLAKLLLLPGRELPLSLWTALLLFRQDLLVALAFALLEIPARGRRAAEALRWILYGAAVLYTAVNVPLWRVTSSPLTLPMLRAARGTLADSIRHHLTAVNLALLALILAAGAAAPILRRRFPGGGSRKSMLVLAITAAAIGALGFAAPAAIDLGGLERSAIAALGASAFPRVATRAGEGDWRASPFPSDSGDPGPPGEPAAPSEDFTRLRGTARGRSVLLVILESAGAGYLKMHGAPEDPMPFLGELAAGGILFENASCVYPESIKGLYAVLASQYPAFDVKPEVHGATHAPSLANVLAAAGYRTGLFHPGRFRYLGMESIVRSSGFETAEDAGDLGGARESSFGVDEPSAVRRILAWIDSLPRAEKFFAAYLPVAGHHPYETPEKGPFPEREEIGRYRNALRYADDAVRLLVEGLRSRGRLEETLLVLHGDHGEAFHQHEANYGHTFYLYEENVHVPLVIAAPGLAPALTPARVRRPASLIDVAPTVLDLLGIAAPAPFQGSSLLEPAPRLSLYFTDYSRGLLGLRDGRWKLIHEIESGRAKLYDLARDPGEREDRSGSEPERVRAYRTILEKWSSSQRERILRLAREGEGR